MTKLKVYITRLIPEKGIDMVKEIADVRIWQEDIPPPREVLLGEVEDIDGLLCLLTDKVDAEVMDRGKKLRVISDYAVGYDNIDVEAATARGILVTNTPGVLTDTTADLAFALLMAAARRIVEGDKYTRLGKWRSWGPQLLLGQDIHHATLGVIGMGRIGSEVARRATGFSMRILYYDTDRKAGVEKELGAQYVDLVTLLKESDFVSLHVPLTEQTKNLIGAGEFRLMKPTAILINTSRGSVVNQEELYQALKEGEIKAAGLDVFEEEPIPTDDPLLTLDNVVVVPHIGSGSVATRTKMAIMAAENLVAGLQGKRPAHPVNPEVLEK